MNIITNIAKGITYKRIKLIFITALIVTGTCIIFWPWYTAWRFDIMQKKIMDLWSSYGETGNIPAQGFKPWTQSMAVITEEVPDSIWEEDTNPDIDASYIAGIMEGILTIEKIDIKTPILKEYTKPNLNISVCSVIKGNHMGGSGNYVIAGHYSRIYGRHFNRLRELSSGDIIIVENETEKYRYRIENVFSVTESDVWVMNNDGDKKIITLITCDYRTDPIGRLIVRGELIEEQELTLRQ